MENKKPDILFISSWYPNKIRPMNGIFVKRHAEACAINCNVSVIYVRSDEKRSIGESVEDNIYTIRGYYKNPRLHIPFFSDVVRLVRYYRMWRSVLLRYMDKKGKPALVNANIIYPVSVIAMLLKYVYKIPYVITEHWSGYLSSDRRYQGFAMKMVSGMAVSRAGAVITVSKKLSDAMQSVGLKGQYFNIPNAVDAEIFNLPATTQLQTGKDFHLIHISSLGEEKNVPGIIRAFKKFHAMHPLSRLTMIWDEDIKGLAEKIEEPFSEQDGIVLLGRQEGAKLAAFIQQADVFVLFSYFETQSVVLLEALCCGVPVISSRCGGPEEFITSANGLLVDVGNETQLADAMENIMKNKAKYDAQKIRDSVVNKVSKEAVAQDFLNIYKKIL